MISAAARAFPRIVCTLGRTTDERAVLEGMAAAGMGMARVNTAYATMEELGRRLDGLRAAGGVPAMLDLKGTQLRIACESQRETPDGRRVLVPVRYPIAAGDLIYVGFGSGPVHFHTDFEDDLDVGDLVTFQNGTIRTKVADAAARGLEARPGAVLLEVLDAGDGFLAPQTGANVPGKRLRVPRLSDRDHQAIALGVERKVECYALSFVREAEDVTHLDTVLRAAGDAKAGLCVKIEETSGIANLEAIVGAITATGREASVMIARGDLFVELPPEKLPGIELDLIARCRALAVPSIVATGLLLSMQEHSRPARSEVCDVAAALRAGTDSLLLSDETSNGKHPVAAVAMLAALLAEYGGRGTGAS